MKAIILKSLFLFLIVFISQVMAVEVSGEPFAVDFGYIEVNGGRIFYEAAGNGPTIIMIHDGLLHRETWNAQFTYFSDSHRVIRWDRRGYGKSESLEASFSHLDDLATLMDTLKVEQATLMGCSSGGLLAIDFTLEHPQKVSSLVLAGPIVSGFEFTKHFRTRGGQEQPKPGAPVAEEIKYWAWKDPWITAPENKIAKEKIEKLLTTNPQDMIGSVRYARGPGRPALGLLQQIKVPTLIIAGESDIPDVHAHIGAIQACIAGSRRVVLLNSGHLAHFEVPEVFNQEVLNFLETIK